METQATKINDNLHLAKLIRKLAVSAQVPETFELLHPEPVENLFFCLQFQRGQIPSFTGAAGATAADKLSNPDPGPSQRTQG